MNRPDAFQPRRGEGSDPLFVEAWHAQALALAFGLSQGGLFAASDWSAALGAALREAEAEGRPDDEHTYYSAVLSALEGLVRDRSAEIDASLVFRIEEWRRAYLNTPHGKPVELAAAGDTIGQHHDDDDHHHDEHR